MEGIKYDGSKRRMEFLPAPALEEIAEVLTYGAKKYAPFNWLKLDKMRLLGALKRHLSAWERGEEIDPESGQTHLGHMGCNALFLLTLCMPKDQLAAYKEYIFKLYEDPQEAADRRNDIDSLSAEVVRLNKELDAAWQENRNLKDCLPKIKPPTPEAPIPVEPPLEPTADRKLRVGDKVVYVGGPKAKAFGIGKEDFENCINKTGKPYGVVSVVCYGGMDTAKLNIENENWVWHPEEFGLYIEEKPVDNPF